MAARTGDGHEAPRLVRPKKGPVSRPLKSSEFVIEHATSQAAAGWHDVVATQKSSAADAWDRLTKAPNQSDPKRHRLKGQLATVVRDGTAQELSSCGRFPRAMVRGQQVLAHALLGLRGGLVRPAGLRVQRRLSMAAILAGAHSVMAFEGGAEREGAAVAHLVGDVCSCPLWVGK